MLVLDALVVVVVVVVTMAKDVSCEVSVLRSDIVGGT